MNCAQLPAPLLAKLLALEAAVEHLTQRVARTQDAIVTARASTATTTAIRRNTTICARRST
jgi:hypothetical protein